MKIQRNGRRPSPSAASGIKKLSSFLTKRMAEKPEPVSVSYRIKDMLVTSTSEEQESTEQSCVELYKTATTGDHLLHRERHIRYLRYIITGLPQTFISLDASRGWLIYWSANSLALLGHDISDLSKGIGETVLACQCDTGGFGGNNQHLAHLAPTYACTSALALCNKQDAEAFYDRIDRRKLYNWLLSLKQKDGSFIMHKGGECDTRASYCALAIASLLNIMTDELVKGTAEYFSRCQTYEGGFSGEAGCEAHGGYAFCVLAGLCLLGPPSEMIPKYLNVDSLLKWLSSRQNSPEMGFSGRTNKLVDACYNHWVGGCWALLENALSLQDQNWLWDRNGLQYYTLLCCQSPKGGLRDKPEKHADPYHTNYALAGLCGAQYKYTFCGNKDLKLGEWGFSWKSEKSKDCKVLEGNWLLPINPIHVLPEGLAEKMHEYFKQKPIEW